MSATRTPQSHAGACVTLSVTSGPHVGRSFEFAEYNTFTVGRSRQATFCLHGDRTISRMHLLVELDPPVCMLKNLSQTGGTFVNGMPVQETPLRTGDVITLGAHTNMRVAIHLGGQATEPFDTSILGGGATDSTPPTDAELRAPDPVLRLSGIRIVRELGRGGMGIVYLAEREKDGRPLAVKTMSPQVAVHEQAVQLFLREVAILKTLRHPHIVRFYLMGEHGGRPYFIMEYVAGRDLDSLLRTTAGRIEIPRAVALFDQVLDALGHAHAQGIVHRDMKPHNVLLAIDGDGREMAKVTDFGLARHFESTGCSGLTRTGNRRGTLAYMAPEQLLDARRADPRSDLYGTAAALYRLLTGHGLWDEKPSAEDPLLLVLNQPPVPIQDRRADVPAALAAVIHKALAREPRDRFATAAEMRAALRACV
jgi:eukaryotic-like serine/threonine-protein kinase